MKQEIKLYNPTPPQVRALKVFHEDKPFVTCLNYGRQVGKAQPLDSLLFTENGTITMGDVAIGDKIFGSNGLTEVLAIHPQGMQDTYEVGFDDGTSVRCNKEHLWEVIDHHDNTRVLSVEKLLKIGVSKVRPKNKRTYNKFKVRLPKALDYSRKDFGIDYYYFGLWLGDGTSIRPNELTTADKETVEYLEFMADTYGLELLNTRKYSYILHGKTNHNPIINDFKQLGVVGNKHIPEKFFHMPKEDRILMLQGIMDADGYIDNRGGTELCTISKKLKDDYLRLARSLGLHAKCKEKIQQVNGEDYLSYRINIKYNGDFHLFTLKRKTIRHNNKLRASGFKFITNIVKLKDKTEQQCITVDAPDSLYVTDGYALTHNSFMAIMDALYTGINAPPDAHGKPINIRFVVPVYGLASKHMDTIFKIFQGHEALRDSIITKMRYKEQDITFHNGNKLAFLSAEAEDNLRGDTAHVMYIDEAAFIKETTYTEILLPMLTQTRGRVLMFSTPNGKNWFYKLWKKGQKSNKKFDKDLVISLRADYRDLKGTKEYPHILKTIMAMKESMSESAFNREVLGEFISDQSLFSGVERATYDEEWLVDYLALTQEYTNGVRVNATKRYIGVDIGVVADYTVLTCIDSNGVVLDIDRFNMRKEKINHKQFKARIKKFLMKHHDSGQLEAAYMEINNKELLYDEFSEDPDLYFLLPFITSSKNKNVMVENVMKLFDDEKIRIPLNDDLAEELYAFTSVQNAVTGKWSYRGTDGTHDDMVMSLLVAVECWREEGSSGFTEVY